MRDLAIWFAGAFTGVVIFASLTGMFSAPTPEELQREFDAHRTCMQTAGKTRCTMTVEDFVRYYELQELLDIPQR